jgi:hypothetical protein
LAIVQVIEVTVVELLERRRDLSACSHRVWVQVVLHHQLAVVAVPELNCDIAWQDSLLDESGRTEVAEIVEA